MFSHYPYFHAAQPALCTHYEMPLLARVEQALPDSTPFLDNTMQTLYQNVLILSRSEYFNLSRQHLEVLLRFTPCLGSRRSNHTLCQPHTARAAPPAPRGQSSRARASRPTLALRED